MRTPASPGMVQMLPSSCIFLLIYKIVLHSSASPKNCSYFLSCELRFFLLKYVYFYLWLNFCFIIQTPRLKWGRKMLCVIWGQRHQYLFSVLLILSFSLLLLMTFYFIFNLKLPSISTSSLFPHLSSSLPDFFYIFLYEYWPVQQINLEISTKSSICILKFRGVQVVYGLPWWPSGIESAYQCRRCGFDPWSGKIPHAVEQLSPCTTTRACVPELGRRNRWAHLP